jgi:hypothetical protein
MSADHPQNTRPTPPRGPDGRFAPASTPSAGAEAAGEMVAVTDTWVKQIEEEFGRMATDNFKMSEALQNINMMIDAQGWAPIYNIDDNKGLNLDQLKAVSEQLREMLIANPLIGRGAELRSIYVEGDGMEFHKENGDKLPAVYRNMMNKPRNRRYVFTPDARREMERVAFTEGNLFIMGDDTTKTFQRVPISEITAYLQNPENPEEIWAYRREWNTNPADSRSKRVEWIYTDIYEGKRKDAIKVGMDKPQPVNKRRTMVDLGFNRQVGWAFGVPDALSVVAWAKLYREFLVNGYVMSRALAQIAFKVQSKTAQGAQNSSVEMSRPGEAGATAAMGAGLDLAPLSTAGKGYDFGSGRPILAMIAAGLGVSVVALSGDSGASSGSSASEATLDSPTRLVAAMRRKTWDEFYYRLFSYMGSPEGVTITWRDLSDETLLRRLQTWVLLHNSGLFKGEIVQAGMAKVANLTGYGKIPDGYLTPNNEKTLAAGAKATTDSGQDGTQDTSKSDGSGQGKSNPAGEAPNDHSTDES